MKILLAGASSLPGYRFLLEALGRGYEVTAIHFSNPILVDEEGLKKVRMDIRDTVKLLELLEAEKPDVIVHMAALGNVDQCERDNKLAWAVTVEPSMAIASYASRAKPFLVYLSTDYVFDGERGNYRESDAPNPVNYYGLTKLAGEVAFMSSGADCAVVRASSIYGFGPGRKNFAKFLVEKLKAGEVVKALVDQYTSPSQASLLGKAIMEIVERRLTGVFHVVGERMSRYEFAMRVADTLGLNKSLIGKAKMGDLNWFARRPRDSSLNAEETIRKLRTQFYSTDLAMRQLKREYEAEVGGGG